MTVTDMSVPTNNPVAYTYTSPNASPSTGSTSKSIPHPPPISKAIHFIAGINTTVYGLAELSPSVTDITVLWLLHPRLQTEQCMAPFASHLITSWNQYSQRTQPSPSANSTSSPHPTSHSSKGLIAVSFDQRNHGSRELRPISNEAWRSGNETHAQDMFSSYHGTAQDTSLLLDYLAAYVFPSSTRQIVQNVVLGISLGGHAAWHCVMQDARIGAAIVVIGCPDYVGMMSDRARLSKRRTYVGTKPEGAGFVGSPDFPLGLLEAVKRYDPVGLLWGRALGDEGPTRVQDQQRLHGEVTEEQQATLLPVMTRCFGGKRILNLAGGADKLVPYKIGKPFLEWLKSSCMPGGWFESGNLYVKDVVVPGVGHEVPPEMVKHMEKFMIETMEVEKQTSAAQKGRRDSRI